MNGLYDQALTLLAMDLAKGRVPPDGEVEEWLFNLCDDGDEGAVRQVLERLIAENRVYRGGDAASYRAVVRERGLVSTYEYDMRKRLAGPLSQRVVFRDTEFPIDAQGLYVLPEP